MSGETEADVSGWTTDTLHTHFIRQLDLLRARITRAESAAQAAQASKVAIYGFVGAATAVIIAVVVVLNFLTAN